MTQKTALDGLMSNDEMTALLEEMVLIKSVSGHIAKVNRVQKIVARELKKIGMKVNFVTSKNHADLVVAEKSGSKKQWITLIAHSDIVNASDDFVGFELNSSGTIAHGPGVIDCKAGFVVALAALKLFFKNHKNQAYPIRFICSPSEEIGSPGYEKNLDVTVVKVHFYWALSLDYPAVILCTHVLAIGGMKSV